MPSPQRIKKYLLLLFTELIPIIIGILIAIQINSFYQIRNDRRQAIDALDRIKKEIQQDVKYFSNLDSLYSIRIKAGEKAFEIFYEATRFKELKQIRIPEFVFWTHLKVNDNTYLELLNTGRFYQIGNEDLRKQIKDYYSETETIKSIFREINLQESERQSTLELDNFIFMLEGENSSKFNYDTSWMQDPSHSTFREINRYLRSNQSLSNVIRRAIINQLREQADILLRNLEEEVQKN